MIDKFGLVIPGELVRCAQPDAKGIADLKALGVECVLKLNPEDQLDEERGWCSGVGIAISTRVVGEIGGLVVSPYQLTDASDELAHLLESFGMVAVHCLHGRDRTGAVIAAWRMLHCDYTFALADAERHLYGSDVALDIADTLIVAALRELAP